MLLISRLGSLTFNVSGRVHSSLEDYLFMVAQRDFHCLNVSNECNCLVVIYIYWRVLGSSVCSVITILFFIFLHFVLLHCVHSGYIS